MPTPVLSQLRRLDPRHSLTLRIIWLMIGLTAAFSLAASIWVGGLAREIVVQQHVRRLLVEADKLGRKRISVGQFASRRPTHHPRVAATWRA